MAGEVPRSPAELGYAIVLAAVGVVVTAVTLHLNPALEIELKALWAQGKRNWKLWQEGYRDGERAVALLVKRDAPAVIARAEEITKEAERGQRNE